ncbi:glycosyltransferase family 4 protein [Oscillatoriales cyanobacterium LEGE 11467]|uniref:Glycosyltransferase family 4 protein n=1 Tax=Zarconia navalis LEGE 11467 TaxID=1828826 RepID=A0A928VWN1_9CYAN|nr:glycosyltransferase family 4 protein [Zarconia navalis]MBE9039616.1 glycosyltransferase family 4 protein [Zarconia navalis LEGE 11467]
MGQHILLYTDDLGIGGVAQFNHSLLCHFASLGYWLTHVCAKLNSPLIQRERELGIAHVELASHVGQDRLRTLKDIQSPQTIFSQTQPDLIVFSDGWPFSNFAAKQAAIALGIPYIIILGFIEGSCINLSYGDGVPYPEIATYQYSRAKAVVAVAQENLNLLHQLFKLPPTLGQVIYYGRPAEYFTAPDSSVRQRLRQELSIPTDAVVCFTAARMEPLKGYQYQIAAIRELQQTQTWSKLYFVWAGSGSECLYNNEQELKDAVAQLGASDRVLFLGQRWDIPDWLDASDIFILPSIAEGMPLSIMEAMAKGLPAIASAVSGVPEELGETGKLLANPNRDPRATIRELAATIETWANSDTVRQSAGQACRERAERLFRQERMLAQYGEVIEGVLSSKLTGSNGIEVFDSARIQELERRLDYGFRVWEAWDAYRQGNYPEMAHNLRKSWQRTPFLRTQTFANWVQSFRQFADSRGEQFNARTLSQLPEWNQLLDTL